MHDETIRNPKVCCSRRSMAAPKRQLSLPITLSRARLGRA